MPASFESLQKILKLEAEYGYENRAVVGGLEKFLPIWANEARKAHLDEKLVAVVGEKLQDYPRLNPEGRAAAIQGLIEILRSAPASTSQLQPTHSEPSATPRQETPRPPRPAPSSGVVRPAAATSTAPTLGLNAPLTVISGIGPANAQILRGIGLNTLEDLLYYFPRRYDDYSQLKPINRLQYGDELSVMGTVYSITTRPVRGGQSQITEAVFTDGTGFLRVSWFNQPWLSSRLPEGTQVVLSGKVDMYLGRLVMNSPDWELVEQDHLHTNRIVPVYPLSGRLTQKNLRRMVFQVVSFWASRVPDFMPSSVRHGAGLIDLGQALSQIHFPDSQDQLKEARFRLAFDEIFLMQLGVLRQKQAWQAGTAQVFSAPREWLDNQIMRLPYALTGAQQRVLDEIQQDLASGRPMNRLLQGDVGSGKTVVAALAAAIIAREDAQAAIMAPTSILAEQHYRNLTRTLAEGENAPLRPEQIRLLVGDTSDADKAEIRAGLESGEVALIIGTHALIEDPITFKRLQLVVIDEQHRFGVAQRSALRSKGDNPHLLVMTATPIPRSLALTVYGDLDISVMDEMPAGRIPIKTHVLSPREVERAYQLLRTEINNGHQAFIIYPLVEKGDRDEGKAAVEEHERLQREIFPDLKLGLLHGRMKPEEKDEVMSRFHAGEFQILVSTSVVEVGVDVPNATVMLVEGANRFGLAQLHQFRGRVGRGPDQSYCLLIPESEDAVENQRLSAMAETNDGFVLAERDLEQRGPGEFLGTRQAGYSELKLANITDVHLIEKARNQAQALFSIDPDLSRQEHEPLLKTLEKFWGNGRGDIS